MPPTHPFYFTLSMAKSVAAVIHNIQYFINFMKGKSNTSEGQLRRERYEQEGDWEMEDQHEKRINSSRCRRDTFSNGNALVYGSFIRTDY